jgi:hypothetical protein
MTGQTVRTAKCPQDLLVDCREVQAPAAIAVSRRGDKWCESQLLFARRWQPGDSNRRLVFPDLNPSARDDRSLRTAGFSKFMNRCPGPVSSGAVQRQSLSEAEWLQSASAKGLTLKRRKPVITSADTNTISWPRCAAVNACERFDPGGVKHQAKQE